MSKIKTGTTLLSAYQVEGDTTGTLVIQTGSTPTTAVTFNADQTTTFAGAIGGALASTATATTQAQFDSTTKIATTAFVQRAIGSWAGGSVVSTNTTIGAAQAGYVIQVSSNATISVNVSGLAVGTRFLILGNGGNVTVNRSDGGSIVSVGVTTLTSFSFVSGSGASLYWDGGALIFENIDQNMKYSQGFANNQSANGYAKIASGVIIQWGTTTLGANTRTTINYPITFPSSGASVTSGSDWSSAGGGGWAPCGACPNNTTSAIIWNTDDTSRQVWYMAVGY